MSEENANDIRDLGRRLENLGQLLQMPEKVTLREAAEAALRCGLKLQFRMAWLQTEEPATDSGSTGPAPPEEESYPGEDTTSPDYVRRYPWLATARRGFKIVYRRRFTSPQAARRWLEDRERGGEPFTSTLVVHADYETSGEGLP